MTENEKAATFIGWNPDKCPHCGHALANHQGYVGCLVDDCRTCVDYYPTNEAPDMMDARNYIKALSVRADQIAPLVEGARHWDRLLDAVYISLRAKNGDAIVAYLARRYDEDRTAADGTKMEVQP